ncbi:putative calcium-binding protein,FG-GAP repeat protein [Xenococcus sp. PCC 7305]|uniref:beta strand repeat-containing protein n=1 Tax=Xenococcus sp. PCC 7305 TaxID=102125 RepID=UPI0002AC29D2|nr:FG-GAP repeat protein [Xenococcus sp. PCC 7305]ELS03899.1 putative calcium-binding protein,FG-GAP repeat protein [Xenococcus sp. PCC 7305]
MVRSSFVTQDLARKNGITLNFSSSFAGQAGDLNGDGTNDIILGDPFIKDRVYVVLSEQDGFSNEFAVEDFDGTNGFVIDALGRNDQFGSSVASAGDINNDGIKDIVIGARFADIGDERSAGESYVIFGQTEPFTANFDLNALNGENGFILNGLTRNDQLGFAVSTVGDINGDGVEDFAVGAPGGSYSETKAGQVYVVFGNGTGFEANFDLASLDGNNGFAIAGVGNGDRLGESVSRAGDLNNDGIDDLIIGAPNGGNRNGEAYVVYGQTEFSENLELANLNQTQGFKITGLERFDELGKSVSSAGDVNADGLADLIVAGSNDAYVIFGQTGNLGVEVNLNTLDGNNGFAFNTGRSSSFDGLNVSSAGDFNGDGFDDIVIGNKQADPYGQFSAGQAYIVYGQAEDLAASITPDDLDGSNGFILNGIERFGDLGEAVSSAGDLNSDGFDDLVITSRSEQSFVIFGSATGGTTANNLAPRLDLDQETPGRNSTTSFTNQPIAIAEANELVVRDDDNTTLVGATIKITNPFDGIQEILSVDTTGTNIVASYDPTTATLSLTGNDFVGKYRNVLEKVTYNNQAAIPDNRDRFIEFALDDGESVNNLSAVATATVEFARDNAIFPNSVVDGATFDTSETLVFHGSVRSLSDAGDVNGDGFADLIIGLPSAGTDTSNDYNTLRSGQSYLVFGQDSNFDANLNRDRLDGNNGLIIEGGDGAFIGRTVSSAGDVNGDGFADVIIGGDIDDGSSGYSSTAYRFATVGGQAYIIFGGENNPSLVKTNDLDGSKGFIVTSGSSPRDIGDLGESVSNLGDLNGDGFDDIIIGGTSEPSLAAGKQYSEGAGLVVFGKAQGFDAAINIPLNDSSNGFVIAESVGNNNYFSANNASLGHSVSGNGDINGDGLNDLVISAPRASYYDENPQGEAYVIFGKSGSFGEVTKTTELNGNNGFVISNGVDDNLGDSVSIVGDINGDGIDELAVSAADEIYVIFGKTESFEAEFNPGLDADLTIQGITSNQTAVEGLGDVNHDGLDDFIVNNSYVIFGDNNLNGDFQISQIDGNNGFIIDNNTLATRAGDVNNDGIADIAVATNNAGEPQTFVLFGNSAPEIDLNGGASGINYSNSFAENAITLSNNLTLQDSNNDFVQGAVITITNLQDGAAESLTANPASTNITANYNPATGTLILTGEDTVANYQQVLGTVSYENNADNPSNINRVVEFVVTDGEAFNNISQVATATIAFDNSGNPNPTKGEIKGTAGNDNLKGKITPDIIQGLEGNDVIEGLRGNDNLFGDNGKDTLKGNRGNDSLLGGRGDDVLQGNLGNDVLEGDSGKDLLFGDKGHDVLVGGAGNDVLKGGSGSDRLEGGDGNDSLFGGEGKDFFVLLAGSGTDSIIDYRDGVDQFVLAEGLEFGQLEIVQNLTNTQIKIASSNEVLANLNSVTANFIEATDFVIEQ